MLSVAGGGVGVLAASNTEEQHTEGGLSPDSIKLVPGLTVHKEQMTPV